MNESTHALPYNAESSLCLSVMTLRNAPLAERVQAAAATGFQSIGWRLEDLTEERYTQGKSLAEIQQLLESSAVQAAEIEFFREWIGLDTDANYMQKEHRLFELAKAVGAKRVNVAVFSPVPQTDIVRALQALSRRAALYNLVVQLEPMAYTPPVNSLQHAWEIIHEVGEPNVGLLIDTWQWTHEGESAETLHSIPAERITGLQLSDTLATPSPDIVQESRHQRCIPGTGSMDLPALLRLLAEHGVRAPLSVEVMSDELDALPPAEAARRVADGTRAVLRQLQT